MRTVDDHLTKLIDVVRSDGFGESEFAGEDGRNSDFVRFDVDIRRDD